jgi:hypothetical protein
MLHIIIIMIRLKRIKILFAIPCLFLMIFASHPIHGQKTDRPNIVFLLSDDQPFNAQSSVDPWFSTPKDDPFLLIMCLPEPHGQSENGKL